MIQLKGIDVSEHQGRIDWDKVKADGIEFAMIRCGYGNDEPSQDDSQFERNVQEAERVGIPWGAYLYSYALNINEAKSEAAHVLRLLKGKTPLYPIAFDMEDADGYKKRRGMPSNAVLADICDTFLSTVKKAGFKVVLYANKNWLTNRLNDQKLDQYDIWVAQWGARVTYQDDYVMWQYTNSGTVNGIGSGVDMNYSYRDFASRTVQTASSDDKIRYRLVTGTFPTKEAQHAAAEKLRKKMGWVVYEYDKSSHRLMTGTFVGRNQVEKAQKLVTKEFGWLTYIKDE